MVKIMVMYKGLELVDGDRFMLIYFGFHRDVINGVCGIYIYIYRFFKGLIVMNGDELGFNFIFCHFIGIVMGLNGIWLLVEICGYYVKLPTSGLAIGSDN